MIKPKALRDKKELYVPQLIVMKPSADSLRRSIIYLQVSLLLTASAQVDDLSFDSIYLFTFFSFLSSLASLQVSLCKMELSGTELSLLKSFFRSRNNTFEVHNLICFYLRHVLRWLIVCVLVLSCTFVKI